MLTIPESIKTLYKTEGTRKNFRVHFPGGELPDITNRDIVSESVHFTESVCSQSVFRFGLAESSVLEFETVGVPNILGLTIEASIEISTTSLSAAEISAIQSGSWDGVLVLAADSDLGYGFFRIPLGTFLVDACPRNHDAMTHRQITAYSRSFSAIEVDFPSQSVWPTIRARASAVMALAFNAGFVEFPAPTGVGTRVPEGATLWDSSRTAYTAGVRAVQNSAPYNTYLSVRRVPITPGTLGVQTPTFVSISLPGYDAAAYEAAGIAIARALPYDLRFNQRGEAIYPSTEVALRVRCPWLFHPCIITTFQDVATGRKFAGITQAIKPGVKTPVINDGSNSAPSGFYVWPDKYRVLDTSLYYVHTGPAGYAKSFYLLSESSSDKYIPISDAGYMNDDPVVTPYGLNEYSPIVVGIKNTGASGANFAQFDSTSKVSIFDNVYSYTASIDSGDLLDGMLEVCGLFGREKRTGGWESLAINNTSPVNVSATDYESVWWDEYDVSPIGEVSVKFLSNDGVETSADVWLRDGNSVYNMTSNYALTMLADTDISGLTAILNAGFLSNTAYAGFTPIEMSMQGWPWVQAGDALAITAHDGTTVHSYALCVEMSGIQHLESHITANAGEIMEV